MLDLQSSFDRGTKPLMSIKDFSIVPTNDSPGYFTSMTTSLLTYQAMLCQRGLIHATEEACEPGSTITQAEFWQTQDKILTDFESCANSTRALCGDSGDPLQACTMAIARESLLTMKLLVHRPLHKTPDRLRPPADGFDVLEAAMIVLQSAEYKTRPEFAQWAWYAWVKWYVLAIVLAELSRAAIPWTANTLTAWQLAETAFERYAKLVSDTKGGLLWTPIAKLYRRVQDISSCASEHDNTVLDTSASEWQDWDQFIYDMIDPARLDGPDT